LVDLFEYMMMHGLTNPKNTKCRTNTVIPPDDGPGEVRNM